MKIKGILCLMCVLSLPIYGVSTFSSEVGTGAGVGVTTTVSTGGTNLSTVSTEVTSLRSEIAKLRADNAALEEENKKLESEIGSLKKKKNTFAILAGVGAAATTTATVIAIKEHKSSDMLKEIATCLADAKCSVKPDVVKMCVNLSEKSKKADIKQCYEAVKKK